MLISRTSMFTGKTHVVDIPITEEQLQRIESGKENMQRICPELTAAQREFLISGITEEEWNEKMGSHD